MTLTTRLSVFFLSLMALVLIGFSVALYLFASSYLHRQVEERLDTVLNAISGAVEAGPAGVEWEPANRHSDFDFSVLGDQVIWLVADDQGHILERSSGGNADEFLADASPSFRPNSLTSDSIKWEGASWQAGQRWFHASTYQEVHAETSPAKLPDDGHKYQALSVTAGISLAPVRAILRQLGSSLVGLSVGIWLVALVAGRFVCRRALLPVSRMAVAASQIDANDLTLRLPSVATKDELEELNRAFNHLLDRLQEAFERQQRFAGDASHQLRTPLTAILGQIEVVLRRERPAEEYRQVLATVQQRASHLARMVESLLFLARADSEARLPTLESVNLTEWLPQHLHPWSEHARACDLVVESQAAEPCVVDSQPALLGELLNILLDNACKYSEPASPITVRLEQSGDAVVVKVADKGLGIEGDDLANLFVPFRRSEEARRRGIDGMGLGLSIAKRLAQAIGGELSMTSQAGQGSCFSLRLTCRS